MIPFLIVLFTFLFMEGVAWFTHKYVMHGFLWMLHIDHHRPNASSFFERNDFFFLIFAIPGMSFIWFGSEWSNWLLFYVGVGITVYGFAYFLIHDIFIHQRIKLFRKSKSAYLMALRRAHKIHHKNINKEEGQCFGMLFVPMKYYKEAKKAIRLGKT